MGKGKKNPNSPRKQTTKAKPSEKRTISTILRTRCKLARMMHNKRSGVNYNAERDSQSANDSYDTNGEFVNEAIRHPWNFFRLWNVYAQEELVNHETKEWSILNKTCLARTLSKPIILAGVPPARFNELGNCICVDVIEVGKFAYNDENGTMRFSVSECRLLGNSHYTEDKRRWILDVAGSIAEVFDKVVQNDDLLVIWGAVLDRSHLKSQTIIIDPLERTDEPVTVIHFRKEKENLPSVEENIPSVEENLQSVEENLPSVEENLPLLEKNLPSLKETNAFREMFENSENIAVNNIQAQTLQTFVIRLWPRACKPVSTAAVENSSFPDPVAQSVVVSVIPKPVENSQVELQPSTSRSRLPGGFITESQASASVNIDNRVDLESQQSSEAEQSENNSGVILDNSDDDSNISSPNISVPTVDDDNSDALMIDESAANSVLNSGSVLKEADKDKETVKRRNKKRDSSKRGGRRRKGRSNKKGKGSAKKKRR